jgi:cation:H+ antiporter
MAERLPRTVPIAAVCTIPGIVLGLGDYTGLLHVEDPAPLLLLVFGAAIVGAAFLIAWAAEAAQMIISAGVALAVLALLAVLPEYAVDFVFTWRAGSEVGSSGSCPGGGDDPCALALANMTGANRLLVGVGWPLVVLVAAWAARRHHRRHDGQDHSASVPKPGHVRLAPAMSTEVAFLGLATLYSLTLPLKGSLTLIDAVVLVALFVAYGWRLAKLPVEEPDLVGTSAWIADRERRPRRRWILGLFAFSGFVILLCAEHFADAAVGTGTAIGVEEFVLVQWVAPLASEAPELIVACLYAWRLKASDSLGALLSSKVNQWTLLVGTIPVVFAISSRGFQGLPLDSLQRHELLITAAQSLFAVSLLVDLRLTLRGSAALLGLFLVQFAGSLALPEDLNLDLTLVLSGLYIGASVIMLIRRRSDLVKLIRRGFTADPNELAPSNAAT